MSNGRRDPVRATLLRLILAILLLAGCARIAPPAFQNTDITGADFGRDFALSDPGGQVRRLADYRGKVVAIFFGYTQCPDVCPTTLVAMTEVMKLLGEAASRVQVVFVTLDPERDTPELLGAYVRQFHPSFVALRGDAAATAATAMAFKVFYQKQPGSTPKTYSLDHSANSYLYDPQGRLRLYVRYGEEPAKIAADIRLLLDGK